MAREVASASAVDDDVDGAAVFGVHANHARMLRGLSHSAKNRRVVEHEDSGIRHEQFKTGDTLADQIGHFFELRAAKIRDDAVEGVVDGRLVVSFFHPGVEGVTKGLALVLNGEIDQRGGAAERCGNGAGLKVVGAGGPAEGHVEVRVYIDAAGEEQMVGGVDGARCVFRRELRGDGGNFAASDAYVGKGGVGRGDDGGVLNDGVEVHWRSSVVGAQQG